MSDLYTPWEDIPLPSPETYCRTNCEKLLTGQRAIDICTETCIDKMRRNEQRDEAKEDRA